MKGTTRIFIFVGSKKTKKNTKFDEIGRYFFSRALDWTKSIRKTAADIFAKSGLEKPCKNKKNARDILEKQLVSVLEQKDTEKDVTCTPGTSQKQP